MTRSYGSEPPQTISYQYGASSMIDFEYDNTTTGSPSLPRLNNGYNHDPMGNRRIIQNRIAQTNVNSQHNNLNQITREDYSNFASGTSVATGSLTLDYDNDGNQSGVTTYNASGGVTQRTTSEYDDLSRLTSLTVAGERRTEFFYDGLSRLRITREYAWNGTTWSVAGVPVKRRVYDGMDIIQERDSTGVVTASVVRAGNIGGILARGGLKAV